ncbi:hypothetical protein C8F01DRAFT_1262252 [Mycena amicta]|nr:hypothetical protein C8F01DRAFT_1262252 [Mycena amicta]
MKIELTAVDVVNNDELKCWTVTGDGRGGVMDGHGDGRCLKWPKGPNGDPQLAGKGYGCTIATVVDYGGAVGACGTPIQDTDLSIALPSSQFATSLCGQQITVTLAGTTKSVSVAVVDECIEYLIGHTHMTFASFEALAPLSEGAINVTYSL